MCHAVLAPIDDADRALVAVTGLSVGTGCRGRNLAAALAGTPTIEGQARCGVMKSQVRPLIIEWPSSDRGALEGLVERGEGLVAVRYAGCEMELVRRCQVGGRYGFTAVEPKRDDQEFRSADDLYAKIPIGAVELEAQLERHGALSLEMTVVGHYDAARERVVRAELRGDCDQATHVITSVTVGAFKLSSGSGAKISAGVNVGVAGGGAGSSAERGFERSDGDRGGATKCNLSRTLSRTLSRNLPAATVRRRPRVVARCCASRSSRSARPTRSRRCASSGRARVAACSSRAAGFGPAWRSARGQWRSRIIASTAMRSASPPTPSVPATGRARRRR